ncbi:putative protein yfnF [Fibrisoma limi BUZ 3]|uniref:Glycosyl transferase family 8 n=1 Tax=Fibrisoma limi BUZ 3 TaxID=1185876 RepID=I2GH53_9BACT|nr:hypothetical protein [Fibrisoma limi]CCH53228.1 putative protein yfnF [Fibrisoma limi BUZ 3]
MKIAYTVSTVSHIPYALILGESFKKHNPEDLFIICIVDKLGHDLNTADFGQFDYIEVSRLDISFFGEMCQRYNLIELCSATKPFFASYIFECYPTNDIVLYFDSDIMIFNSLTYLEEKLNKYDILLTPHIVSEHNKGDRNLETQILNTGIYNAGFFGLRRSINTDKMLSWWKDRLITHGYTNFIRGMYADQLWLNFVPLFFEGVRVEMHVGCNVAYWNLHERSLKASGNKFIVNDCDQLLFFHFSGYHIDEPYKISIYHKHLTITERTDVEPIFFMYKHALSKYESWQLRHKANSYVRRRAKWIEFIRGWLIVFFNKGMEALGA